MLLIALGILAGMVLASFGWGRIFQIVLKGARLNWTVTIVLGLALQIFLGGFLNLLGFANLFSLATVLLCGASFAVWTIWKHCHAEHSPSQVVRSLKDAPWTSWCMAAVIFLIMAFTVSTQLPPSAFNAFDDFQKYFAHPMRMLETGTLYASPLSALGSETLGGMAFLQGYLASVLPIFYVNGTDAVLGLFLCLLMAPRFAGAGKEAVATGGVSLLGVFFINPQYVNVSPLYLGSALIMAIAAVTLEDDDSGREMNVKSASIGMLYAALLAIKSTFAPFVAFHLIGSSLAVGFVSRDVRRAIRWGASAGAFALLFLSPWLLLHAPHYLAALQADPSIQLPSGGEPKNGLDFLSAERLFYGATGANYLGLVCAASIAALIALWTVKASANPQVRRWGMASVGLGFANLAAFVFLALVAGPDLVGPDTALRLYVPVAIGTTAPLFGLAARLLCDVGWPAKASLRLLPPFIIAFVPVAAFAPSLVERVEQIVRYGTALSFSGHIKSPEFQGYNALARDGSVRREVEAAQSSIPLGEPAIVWINAPFFLDYSRNDIFDVEPAGLATKWAFPPSASYVMWEYKGYPTRTKRAYLANFEGAGSHERKIAVRSVNFVQLLEKAVNENEVLFNDGRIVVFRLSAPLEQN